MRLGLCLGAWWPEGRSSSSVFQFLPSCSWSACQMAVNGKNGYRGELSLWWFLQLCFCSAFESFAVLVCGVTIPHWDALIDMSQYTFYSPWTESFQDSWWDPEFPQLSQMVQSLPGFLNLSLNVCSPCQVLGDVYTEVLEATHPLHRSPTDHKGGVGPLLSLPEVDNQLFSFAHVQRETVVLAPWCESLHLIQVCGLVIVVNEAQNHSIVCKFDNRSGAVRGHAVVCVERVEQGAQDTALWGSYVQGDGVGGELADFHHLWSGGEEILNPVTEWSV